MQPNKRSRDASSRYYNKSGNNNNNDSTNNKATLSVAGPERRKEPESIFLSTPHTCNVNANASARTPRQCAQQPFLDVSL